jgi:hypothetical protein
MHIYQIGRKELSEKIGCSESYLSAMLNGKGRTRDAEFKVRKALTEIVEERKARQ